MGRPTPAISLSPETTSSSCFCCRLVDQFRGFIAGAKGRHAPGGIRTFDLSPKFAARNSSSARRSHSALGHAIEWDDPRPPGSPDRCFRAVRLPVCCCPKTAQPAPESGAACGALVHWISQRHADPAACVGQRHHVGCPAACVNTVTTAPAGRLPLASGGTHRKNLHILEHRAKLHRSVFGPTPPAVHARSGPQQAQQAFRLENMHGDRAHSAGTGPARCGRSGKPRATRAPPATARWLSGASREWRPRPPPASKTNPPRHPALRTRAGRSAWSTVPRSRSRAATTMAWPGTSLEDRSLPANNP